MNTAIIVALISAIVSLVAAGVAYLSQRAIAHLNSEIAEQSRQRTKLELADEVMARYRDPLLAAVFDLQSRLYGFVALEFMRRYYIDGDESAREYAIENSLYIFGEYFAWVEIIRKEIQFLDLGEQAANEKWVRALNAVRDVFAGHKFDQAIHVFRGEQRAIGELMMVPLAKEMSGRQHESLGYAAFVLKRRDEEFARWFRKLEGHLKLLAAEPGAHLDRVIHLQHALVDVLDILDADCVRFPRNLRSKLPLA